MNRDRPHPAAPLFTLVVVVALLASATAAAAFAWRQSDDESTAQPGAGDAQDPAALPAARESLVDEPAATGRAPDHEAAQGERRGGPRREGRGGGQGNDRRNAGPPDEDEWLEASESMKKLAPNAWARFLEIPEHAPFRPAFQRRIVDRYQELDRLKKRNEDQYQSEVKQIQVEDDIFGLAAQLRGADATTAERVKADIRQKVEELIELRIANRERRIERLAQQLNKERGKLESDKKDKPATVQRKYDEILSRAGANGGLFANPGGTGGRRPGGKRGQPPPQPATNAPESPAEQSSNDGGGDPPADQ